MIRNERKIMFSIKRALVAAVAVAGLSVFGAGAAFAGTTHTEGTVYLANHGDTDFSGAYWANDNITLHFTVTPVTGGFVVDYRDNGTFVTSDSGVYVGASQTVSVPADTRGVMSGSGEITVQGGTAPSEATLKTLPGFPQLGDTGVGTIMSGGGTITDWQYDYNYKIPGTAFTAEQSNTVNTP